MSAQTTSQWRAFTAAATPQKAEKVARRLLQSLAAESATTIEPYQKGGHEIRFELPISTADWPHQVLATLQLAQLVGRGWILSGIVEDGLDLWSNDASISGVEHLHVVVERPA